MPSPNEQVALGSNAPLLSPNWLFSTYLFLAFGELLICPIGVSLVTKLAPPMFKGLMMGGWLAAMAIGSYLISIGNIIWGKYPVSVVWCILISICLIAAIILFIMMRGLEKVAK